MKQVHISPKLNQRRQLNIINDLILNNGKSFADEVNSKSGSIASPTHGKDLQSAKQDCSPNELKSAISILIHEGLDLILNVLNNVSIQN